ncbi:ankyrin repeat-containing domain protein [Russula vinacea]|nr:ankyrin repeat-containing domain protein [Russula vinacea]
MAALARRHFELARYFIATVRRGAPGDCAGFCTAFCDANVRSNRLHSIGLCIGTSSHNLDPNIFRSLLDHGADPNLRANDGLTPLYRASKYGKVEIVRLLVERGASVEVQDKKGKTPLDVASGKHRDEIINYC